MRRGIFDEKYFRVIVLVIVVFFTFISIYSLIQAARLVGRPFPGFLLYRNLTVAEVSLFHWMGYESDLKYYDRIVGLEGRKISSPDEVYSVVVNKHKPGGTPINYTISRNNRLINVTVPTMKFELNDFLLIFGVVYFVGLVFFITGISVYCLKPNLDSSRVFLMFCSSMGFWFTSIFDTHSTHSLYDVPFLALLLAPTFLSHLAFIFPFRRKELRIVMLPYLFSFLLFTLHMVYFSSPHIWAKLERLFWVYIALGALVFVISTIITYLKPNSALDKQRAQIMLLGSCAGLFLPGLGAAVFVLFEVANLNNLAIPVMFFPLSIAYAIMKHKLFDIDEIVKKTLVYGALTGIVGGVFALLIAAASTAFTSYGDGKDPAILAWKDPAVLMVMTILLVLILNPIKNRIQDLIDLMFFRKKYDYRRTIEEISSAMTSFLNLDEIINKIINTTQQTMFSTPVFVILFDWNSADYIPYVSNKNTQSARGAAIKKNSELLNLMNRYKEGIFKEDLIADERYIKNRDKIIESFEDFDAALLIPMFSKEQLIGILSLGEKKSGLNYSSEDIKLLNTLANQSAIAIENAFSYKLVEDYAKKLKEANEELQETQAQLIQAEKMSAIGQLAAGIAHEIRNPLNIIEGSRYYLSQVIDEGNSEVLREYLGYIKHEIERTNYLIDNLLKFSKLEPQHFELLDVNNVLENAMILVRKQLSDSSVGIITNFNYQIPNIMGDRSQLWQVFINIIMNAAQAMLGGGELRIDTGYGNRDEIFISFTDTGVGIDEKDITKIFNPFFTTKDKGTGLGLSISYRIIEEHKGRIRVSSERGKGATFVLELPVSHNNE